MLNKQHPLLQIPTSEALLPLQEAETLLETQVMMESEFGETFKLKLKEDYLLLYKVDQDEHNPIALLHLNEEVRLQKILASKPPHKDSSHCPSNLKGFSLVSRSGARLSFYIQFAQLTRIWVRCLSRQIYQLGFHECFKPIRKLGKGSSASVYEIVRLEDGERLAAKVFNREGLLANPQKFYSFKNQIEVLRNLEHRNLLSFEGVFQTQHSYYLVSEVLRGGNLLQFLMSRRSHLSLEEMRRLLRGVMVGLGELERADLVHRDIKLENIMLREKDSLEPVIADFGLSVYAWEEDYGFYQCGTPGYLSPEIIRANRGDKITPKSDVFSAGVVFHVLLMGRYLFTGKDPKSVFEKNREMGFDLQRPEYEKVDSCAMDLLRKMLAVEVEERLGAAECLQHPFLKEAENEKMEVSPASTSEDYHF